jgi:hypothetical protein
LWLRSYRSESELILELEDKHTLKAKKLARQSSRQHAADGFAEEYSVEAG